MHITRLLLAMPRLPGEREADLGRAHKAVFVAVLTLLLLVMVGGEFHGEGVEEEGEAALHGEVEGEGEVVGVEEIGGVVEEAADGLALVLAQRGAVDEVRPRGCERMGES